MLHELQTYSVSFPAQRSHVAPLSRLYSLEPIGISTSYTESLTGYIARLAQEHALSTRNLIVHFIIPVCSRYVNKDPNSNWVDGSWKQDFVRMNGSGKIAGNWIDAIEELTIQPNIGYTTLFPWRNLISSQSKLGSTNPFRQWCNLCYYEWMSNESTIYEPLIWNLSGITLCPRHKTLLSTKCEYCEQGSPPLHQFSRPGYCSKCRHWLGSSTKHPHNLDDDELKWQAWLAQSAGEIISSTPNINCELHEPGIEKAIRVYQKYAGWGALEELNYHLYIDSDDSPKKYKPSVKISFTALMRLGYFLGVSPVQLLINPEVENMVKESLYNGVTSSFEAKYRDVKYNKARFGRRYGKSGQQE